MKSVLLGQSQDVDRAGRGHCLFLWWLLVFLVFMSLGLGDYMPPLGVESLCFSIPNLLTSGNFFIVSGDVAGSSY